VRQDDVQRADGAQTADGERGMKHRPVSFLCVLMLVMCVVVVLVWVRSHWVADGFFWKRQEGRVRVVSASGVMLWVSEKPLTGGRFLSDVGFGYTRQPPHDVLDRVKAIRETEWGWRRAGLTVVGGRSALGPVRSVSFPYWMVVLVLGLLPSWRFVWLDVRRRRRRRAGLCVRCGYDLRASNERCPECGEEIGKETRGSDGR